MDTLFSWFKGIKGKLLLSAMVPFVGFIVSGYISFTGIGKLGTLLTEFHEELVPHVEMLYQMRESRNRFGFKAHNALSDMRLNLDPQEDFKAARLAIEEYKKALDGYSKTPFSPEERQQFDQVKDVFPKFIAIMDKIQQLLETKDPKNLAEAESLIQGDYVKFGNITGKFTENTLKYYTERAEAAGKLAEVTEASVNFWTIVVIASATLLALILSIWTSVNVSGTLASIASRLGTSSSSVTNAVEQLTQAGNSLSQSSTEAAASLEETVASLEEMSSMVQLNSDNAKQAAALSATSREAAEKGEQEIESLIKAMTDISTSSKKIEEIISVIDDIAFQTNLLALNASVEAARAGEQGKGFAVVAEAVRALAQRSADAAKDINVLIKDSVSKVEQGGNIAGRSGTVLHNIVTSVKKVADLNTEIASASAEQTAGIQQISKAMNQLDQSSQSNAASAEEIAATSSEISNLAVTSQNLTHELSRVIYGTGSATPKKEKVAQTFAPAAEKKSNVVAFTPAPKTKAAPASSAPVKKSAPAKTQAQEMIPFDDESTDSRAKVGTTDGF